MATEVLVSTGSPSPQSMVTVAAYARPVDPHRRRLELGGVLLDQVGLSSAVERIREFARSGQPHQIVTVNLDFVSIASRDDAFRSVLNTADLAVADGMPLVWLSHLKHQPLEERVAGVELVSESCRVAQELGCGVFLLGAGPGVAEAAAARLQAMYPGLQIAGTYSPPIGPLSAAENERIVRRILSAAPSFLFVALGAPRQDLWIREFQPHLQVPVAMGVGCVLDLLAGSVKRAPLWMQRNGLEWAFRLGHEPQRLWRRYLVNDVPTLIRLVLERPPAQPSEVLAVGS